MTTERARSTMPGRRAFSAVAVLLVVSSGCSEGGAPGRARQSLGSGTTLEAPPAPTDVVIRPGNADDLNFLHFYVLPRAYPNLDLGTVESRRLEGREQLRQMRQALGMPWIGEQGVSGMGGAGGGASSCGTCPAGTACSSGICKTICQTGEFRCPLCDGCDELSDSGVGVCSCPCGGCNMGTGGGAPGGSGGSGGATGGSGGSGGVSFPANPCGWTSLGPTNVPGRVLDVSIDPTQQSRMLAGTVGGAYYSEDGGRRWSRFTDSLFAGPVSSSLFIGSGRGMIGLGDHNGNYAPDCPLVAGAPCTGGIYVFDPPGTLTHADVVSNPGEIDNAVIYRLVPLTELNPTTVFAATSKGVYQGTESGGVWTFTLHGLSGLFVRDLEVDNSGAAPILYAGQLRPAVIWKYDGNAATPLWEQKMDGISVGPAHEFVELTLSRSATNVLYAAVGRREAGGIGEIYKTTTAAEPPDGSSAWTQQKIIEKDCWWNPKIQVHPTNPENVICGSLSLLESGDSGATWSDILSSPDPTYPLVMHVDMHALKFMPGDPTTLVVGNDGGVYKSTPRTSSTWSWRFLGHGLRNVEAYTVSGQLATASMVAVGLQDNGSQLTFGNRAWYVLGGADGMYAQVDAANSNHLYSSWQETPVYMNLQPVPGLAAPSVFVDQNTRVDEDGTPGIQETDPFIWQIAGDYIPTRGVVTDSTLPGVAIAVGRAARTFDPNPPPTDDIDIREVISHDVPGQVLLKTVDGGISWQVIFTPGPDALIGLAGFWGDHRVTIAQNADAIGPGAGNKAYFAAVQRRDVPIDGGTTTLNSVWMSLDGGANWQVTSGIPDDVAVRGIYALDSQDAVAVGGRDLVPYGSRQVFHFNGGTWTELLPSSPTFELPGVPTTTAILDPANPTRVYAGTIVGVFTGTISGTTLDWAPIDFALPNGIDVMDLWVNPETRQLLVSAFGYGIYAYDLDRPSTCPQEQLVVRDNVFDIGKTPSVSGVPDPEHPKAGPLVRGIQFYQPDDTPGNAVYWWDSTDIRIDVPSARAPSNRFALPLDNYEFEGCPLEALNCGVGKMIDSQPSPANDANVYVQVQQRGLGNVSGTRIMTLWADASTEVPPLPADFWTTTFPPRDGSGNGACGLLLAAANGWQAVGCQIATVSITPGVPEVFGFPWSVPQNAPEHSCMLAVVDSAGSQIPAELRSQFRVEDLTPNSPLIAQRNLHIVASAAPQPAPPPPTGGAPTGDSAPYGGTTSIWVPNFSGSPMTKDTFLVYSQIGLERLSFMLPAGVQVQDLPRRCGRAPNGPRGGVAVITLPRGVAEGSVALGASERLVVDDGVKVEEADTGFGTLTNAGDGVTRVGLGADVGSVISTARTVLESGAHVHGSVTVSRSLLRGARVTVDGNVLENAVLDPLQHTTWTIPAFPERHRRGHHGGRDINVVRGRTTLPPGGYGSVSVGGGARLVLTAGEYRMESLRLGSPMSTLELDTSAGAVVVYVRSDFEVKGMVLDPTGLGSGGLFVVMSSDDAEVSGRFEASVVAPFVRELVLGGASGHHHGFGRPHASVLTGSFFGKSIKVNRGTRIVHRRFKHWHDVGSCAPLSNEERAKATSLGLDPGALYPVPASGRHVLLPVAANSRLPLGLRYESGTGRPGSAGRFRAISVAGTVVRGGSTYFVRH